METDITSHYLMTHSGQQLHVLKTGMVKSPACVLIHGYGDGAFVWGDVMRSLGTVNSLIAVDLPGHGHSYRAKSGPYTTSQAVSGISDVLRALGPERLVLLGHSWGGIIALHLAAELRQRVAGLVLVDTGPEENKAAMEYVTRTVRGSLKAYRSVEEYAFWLMEQRPLADPAVIRRIAREALYQREQGEFELRVDPALVESPPTDRGDVWSILRKVDTDMLVVRGEMSGVLLAGAAEKMAAASRHCSIRTVPQAGHSVMIDNPQGFISIVAPFLAATAAKCQAITDTGDEKDVLHRNRLEKASGASL